MAKLTSTLPVTIYAQVGGGEINEIGIARIPISAETAPEDDAVSEATGVRAAIVNIDVAAALRGLADEIEERRGEG